MLCHTIVTEIAPRRAILLYTLTSEWEFVVLM